jgi:hypothetical protein
VREILLVCPQERDFALVDAAGLEHEYRVRPVGADLDAHGAPDPATILAEALALSADGVVATKDRAALLASIVAERRRLPGPAPAALLACQHKPSSRERQREVVPEATPRFAVLDGTAPFEPPFFVKPAVGRLSQHARRIDALADLDLLPAGDGYADGFEAIAALAGVTAPPGRGYLAEELLAGDEVTLEGFVHRGRVTVVGVTDSVKYPGTNSFERFEYPSRLSPARLDELAAIAERLLPALGFDAGFFNVELYVPDRGPAKVIEVNGRIASQFAPLVQALHGRSTYEALFRLACGDDPEWRTGAPDGAAVSYVLRRFEDALVEAVPDPEPGVEILVRPGRRLSEQGGANDVASFRLAIVYEAGETREEALARARSRAQGLRFRLGPALSPRGR